MEIKIAIWLSLLATLSFVCAPLALSHSLKEGRRIQGFLLQWSFNSVGISICITLAALIFKTLLGEM